MWAKTLFRALVAGLFVAVAYGAVVKDLQYMQDANCVWDGIEALRYRVQQFQSENHRTPGAEDLRAFCASKRMRFPVGCSQGDYLWLARPGGGLIVMCAGPHAFRGTRNALLIPELVRVEVPEAEAVKLIGR